MTLLSSGMGEVADENFMRVDITPDTVSFSLIALNSDVEMKPVTWYSIPAAPGKITGPEKVNPPESLVKYEVSTVFNATSYQWTVSSGISGSSVTKAASLSFDDQFQTGQVMVRAVNDGIGESEPLTLNVQSSGYTSFAGNENNTGLNVLQNQEAVVINFTSDSKSTAQMKIAELSGKMLIDKLITVHQGLNTLKIDKHLLSKGVIVLNWKMNGMFFNKKIVIY